MVSRALYNFQAQNYRELSFKKGDLVYIRRQVIWFFDHEFIKFWKTDFKKWNKYIGMSKGTVTNFRKSFWLFPNLQIGFLKYQLGRQIIMIGWWQLVWRQAKWYWYLVELTY